MRIHKAKIIDLEPTRNNKFYYPIYQYKDKDGTMKTCKGESEILNNPFVVNSEKIVFINKQGKILTKSDCLEFAYNILYGLLGLTPGAVAIAYITGVFTNIKYETYLYDDLTNRWIPKTQSFSPEMMLITMIMFFFVATIIPLLYLFIPQFVCWKRKQIKQSAETVMGRVVDFGASEKFVGMEYPKQPIVEYIYHGEKYKHICSYSMGKPGVGIVRGDEVRMYISETYGEVIDQFDPNLTDRDWHTTLICGIVSLFAFCVVWDCVTSLITLWAPLFG